MFYQDVGDDGVEVAAGARVEGEDPAAGREQRERDALRPPERPVGAAVADERERAHDDENVPQWPSTLVRYSSRHIISKENV